jgi:hypothetical protein
VRSVVLGLVLGLGACSSRDESSRDAAVEEATVEGGGCFDCPDAMSDVSLAARAQITLQRTCTGLAGETFCHLLDAGGMSLGASGDNFAQIIDVPSNEVPSMVRVRPSRPSESYLYLKLVGDGGIEGGRMPFGGPYDPATVALFHDWIEAGAPTQ